MFDLKQPLWMPKGSVRALIALSLTAVTCYLAVAGAISGESFLAVQGTVAAFYFGAKAGNPPA